MDRQELVNKVLHVKSWQRGGTRAPHKPLLLLYAIAKFLSGQDQIAYAEAEEDLRNLLADFGPWRKVYRPFEPFWRLQKDGLWEVASSSPFMEDSSGGVSRQALLQKNAHGCLTKEIKTLLHKQPDFVQNIIEEILNANFPETIHEDILQAIGIDFQEVGHGIKRRKRCPKFREKVLQAYDYRCAVCGFDVRLGHTPIALEAAHIKWHQAGGPDTEKNSLALCALHHKLFDRGAFTLSDTLEVLVSDRANGYHGFREWLLQYQGERIRHPQRSQYSPDFQFVSWHTNEVFMGSVR